MLKLFILFIFSFDILKKKIQILYLPENLTTI